MDTTSRRPANEKQDDARLWRVAAFGGMELLRARFAGFSFTPHAHDEYMIVVTEGGIGLPRFWGAEQPVSPGDLFVLGPGEVHAGGPARASVWRYRSFYVPAALMRRVGWELTGNDRESPRFVEEVICDPTTAARLRQTHAALEEPVSALESESRLLEALAGLMTRHGAHPVAEANAMGPEHRSVRRAKDYLEALPGENVSLEALAREAGIGPFHLCRVFRRETGLSPHAYQIHVRMRLAKSLLMRGTPISRVAAEAGFADQAHLTRHFKRMFGVTPGQYALGGTATAPIPDPSPAKQGKGA
jgi:AraC-like DNA-binding protein